MRLEAYQMRYNMKRIFSIVLALFCATSFGATLNPIQLLNPSGSTSGQVIASTGVTTPPAWTTITLAGLGGLTIANNLSDVASPTSALTNLGGLSTTTAAATYATITNLNLKAPLASASPTGTWTFATRPTFNGATPYDSANLTISNYALLSGAVFTGPITPSQTAGIVGTTTNNNANSGSVGEYGSATATTVSMGAGTPGNLTSASLTAGDYDAQCTINTTPAAGTTVLTQAVGVSTVSATQPSLGAKTLLGGTNPVSQGSTFATPTVRLSIASTTTLYCVGTVNFSGSTLTADGLLRWRRVR